MADLAKATDLPESLLIDLECGRRTYDQRLLETLAREFECTPAELLAAPPSADLSRVEPRKHPHNKVGHYLKEWRLHRRLTISEPAALSGMSTGNLSRLERGLIPYSQHSFETLAAALGTNPATVILVPPEAATTFARFAALTPSQQLQLAKIAEIIVGGCEAEHEPRADEAKPVKLPLRRTTVPKQREHLAAASDADANRKLEALRQYRRR